MNFSAVWDQEHAKRNMALDAPLDPVRKFFERISKGLSILDIGCGAGTNAWWLSKSGYRVWGFDSSAAAIRRIIRSPYSCPNPTVVVADATKPWPYRDQSFDVAFEVRVFENLTHNEAQFAHGEVFRVLKPGGLFYSLTASQDRPNRFTTCGVVRKVYRIEIYTMLQRARLQLVDIKRQFKGELEDWETTARKPP